MKHRVNSSPGAPRRRAAQLRRRKPGCRHCGALDHYTKACAGRLARVAVRQVGAVVKKRLGLDPLGIARTSWLVGVRVPRYVKEGV